MSFSIQSITDSGREAVQTALDTGLALTFTGIKTGNGLYTDGEDVTEMTALKSPKNTYPIGSKDSDPDGVTLGAVLVNYDGAQTIVAAGYRVNEIGLYCRVGDTEYLYAVAAVPDDGGRELPGYDGSNLTQIIHKWYVAYTNDVDIEVDTSGAFALAQDFEDHEAEYIASEEGTHGARYFGGKLQVKDGDEWSDANTLPDDSTALVYKFGVNNGLLYIEEV